jgi:phage gpG-like protein
MAAVTKVDSQEVRLGLSELGAAISDRDNLLRICGEVMRTSIARTFREEGSPAGSWPALAPSTRKNKLYTAGHKLLILSGRLFGSITYLVTGGMLVIGTDVVYARVQQMGSRDWMGGAAGPRTREQMLGIGPYSGLRRIAIRHKMVEVTDRHGNKRMVPRADRTGMREIEDSRGRVTHVRARYQGPENAKHIRISGHTRRQNIPPRPFLVFRPEDPNNMVLGIEAYLRGKAVRIGTVGAA